VADTDRIKNYLTTHTVRQAVVVGGKPCVLGDGMNPYTRLGVLVTPQGHCFLLQKAF
jgi:hypothetical protein